MRYDAQWRVWLPESAPEPVLEESPGDRQETARQASGPDTTPPGRLPADSELIETLRSEVAYLRSALDTEMEARRRADHLVARVMDRLPEISAGLEEALRTHEGAPTASERTEAFWHTPTGAPTTLRAWIRRLLGR